MSAEKATWHTAREICDSKSNGQLLYFSSKEELDYVTNITLAEKDESFWIGLNDIKNEGQWKRADGQIACYHGNWGAEEPNGVFKENCAIIDNKKEIHDVPCETKQKRYICKQGQFFILRNIFFALRTGVQQKRKN